MKTVPPLRLAIVGLGVWGKNYVRLLGSRSDVRVCALIDPREEARNAAREMLSSNSFASLDELPHDSADGVVIATPSDTHAQLATQVLARGSHVLVEKPLAKRLSEALRVAETPGAASRLLVGHLTVYAPTFRWLQQVAEAGNIGQAKHVAATRTSTGASRNGDDVLWALGPHDVLAANRLVGRPVEHVRATQSADRTQLDLDIRFEGGATATLCFARAAQPQRTLTLLATLGEAHVDEVTGATRLLTRTVAKEMVLQPHRTLLEEQCDGFIDSIRSGAAPQCGVTEAVTVVSVLAAAETSLRHQSCWVAPTIPSPTPSTHFADAFRASVPP